MGDVTSHLLANQADHYLSVKYIITNVNFGKKIKTKTYQNIQQYLSNGF